MNIQFSSNPDAPQVAAPVVDAPQVPVTAPPVAPVAAEPVAPTVATPAPASQPVAQAGAEPVAPVVDNTPKIGDIPEPQFWGALNHLTGGKITQKSDLEAWEALQAAHKKLPEIETKLNQLEGWKQGINPIAAKIDEMARAGASNTEIQNFVAIQAIDTSKLGDMDVIRTALALENPDFDADMLQALMVQKGVISETDIPDASTKVAIAIEAKAARAKIESQKVQAATPLTVQQHQQAEQARQELVKKWEAVTAPPILHYQLTEGDYSAEIQLSPEAIKYGEQVARGIGIQQGADPATNQKNFTDLVRLHASGFDLERIVAFVAKDAAAKAQIAIKQQQAGAPPAPVQAGDAPGAPKKAWTPTQFSS